MDKRQTRAFEEFAAKSGAELLRIATLLTPDPHIAEDVYQETLQRLAARWSRVDNPKAFCRRVMHNIIVDQTRARARRPHELRLFDTREKSDPRSADPHHSVVRSEPHRITCRDRFPLAVEDAVLLLGVQRGCHRVLGPGAAHQRTRDLVPNPWGGHGQAKAAPG
jgi:DNA-directed RNA polymerase specialized sigma24 family protein